jgi:solute carrier family 10 (sodium/bile acid cotransporter), member 7
MRPRTNHLAWRAFCLPRNGLAAESVPSSVRKSARCLPALVRWCRSEWFVLALIFVVAAASVVPCHGIGADLCGWLAMLAISSLFFLQGARLSRDAVLRGMTDWRLHLAITTTTFVLFPLLGLGIIALFEQALPPALRDGILFVCALPSTVQSSIALTSIAQGNIPAAICAATASNLIGIVLTPLLLAAMLHVHGGGIDFVALWKILAELLLPFVVGHLMRPWIGGWADRNRAVLAVTDRGSILIVVYAAFSAAVIRGIWRQLPPATLATVALIDLLLLAAALALMTAGSRASSMSRADEVAIVFCGSQKSLVTGAPMANLLFGSDAVGIILLPIMIYHMSQLFVCAWLARRYARSASSEFGYDGRQFDLIGDRPAE